MGITQAFRQGRSANDHALQSTILDLGLHQTACSAMQNGQSASVCTQELRGGGVVNTQAAQQAVNGVSALGDFCSVQRQALLVELTELGG